MQLGGEEGGTRMGHGVRGGTKKKRGGWKCVLLKGSWDHGGTWSGESGGRSDGVEN